MAAQDCSGKRVSTNGHTSSSEPADKAYADGARLKTTWASDERGRMSSIFAQVKGFTSKEATDGLLCLSVVFSYLP